ncbi:MAG: mechanosensitive ion channel [Vicingaceae bacterium]
MRAFLLSLFFYLSFFINGQVDTAPARDYSSTQALSATIPDIKNQKEKVVHDTIQVIKRDTIYVEQTKDSIKVSKKTALENLKEEEPNPFKNIGEIFSFWKILWAIIICIIAYYFLKFLILIIGSFNKRTNNSYKFLKNIGPFIRIAGWITVVFIIIEGVFNPPRETVFAVLASAGIAVGFAAQDILKNIFGGIMILFDQPFQIGDKIEVGEYYGEVVGIGLRSTRIVTKDDSLVSIPNSEVVNTAVSNSNAGENNCQVVSEIYLPINIDTALVRKIATETAQTSRYIYLNKPITVLFFNEVKERRSYLKMRLKAYVSDLKYEFAFKSDMTEIFLKELLEKEIISYDDMKW